MTGEYAILKFRKPQDNDIVTEFLLPDKSLFDKMARLKTLADYRVNGYICCGFVTVDKETYLNARLNESVREYCENEDYRKEVVGQYHRSVISNQVFFETMRLIDDFKWTCLKKIEMQVRRLIREDFSVQNEVALQLFDAVHGNNSLLTGGTL